MRKIIEDIKSHKITQTVLQGYASIANPINKKLQAVFSPFTTPIKNFVAPVTTAYSNFKTSYPLAGNGVSILLWCFKWGIIALMALIVLTTFGLFGDIPSRDEIHSIENANSTEIYTSDSVMIGKFFIENRTEISLEKISPYLITALLAVEDKRFFEHSGIDVTSWLRIFKGMATNNQSLGGGSTLSQQLAKNLYPRRSYRIRPLGLLINKIRENVISIKLENIYNKEELISLYLNTVPFGGDRYGINVASKYFYNKKVSELDPQEAATLIGMLKASTALDPTRNPENSKKRRNLVLKRMLENKDFVFNDAELAIVSDKLVKGVINEQQYEQYIEAPLAAKRYSTDFSDGLAPYLREYLRTNAMPKILSKLNKADGSTYNLYKDGLKIYTSIDSKIQQYAEESVTKHMSYLQGQFGKHWKGYPREKPWGDDRWLDEQKVRSDRYQKMKEAGESDKTIDSVFTKVKVPMTIFTWKNGGGDTDTIMSPMDSIKHYFLMLNTGFMALDHKTSQIKAWVGGTNFKYFKYDHIQSTRQVGSTFKPIVYAAAIKDSLRPCQYFNNIQKTYEDWTPRNSDNRYGGWYSMVGGLTYSVNTIAATLMDKVGIQKVLDLATAMGVTSTLPREYGIALGSADISLFDMMKVYGTIANAGLRPEPIVVLTILDRNGNVIYSYKDEVDKKKAGPKVQALTVDEAATMARMMRSVIDNGTGNSLRSQYVPDGEFAGKTGTTQNHSDGWFMSFNSELTTGCWVGGPSPAVRFRTMDLGRGAAMALPIVGGFWYKLLRDKKYTKLALAKFPENVKAANATGCPFRIGINPNDLFLMMQDTTMAQIIRENRYRGLKEMANEYFGTEQYQIDGENIGGGEMLEGEQVPLIDRTIDNVPIKSGNGEIKVNTPIVPKPEELIKPKGEEVKKKGGG